MWIDLTYMYFNVIYIYSNTLKNYKQFNRNISIYNIVYIKYSSSYATQYTPTQVSGMQPIGGL